ncbi:MAG: RecQ family ATP-dependent DNA helicase [Desulfamplus sp.]|nr:RecQ family ATP-dependent DNA helicase [Desulfamplus sp.]
MKREQAEIKLRHIFGLKTFYDSQWVVIERLFEGKRVLFIEKTGFGKSLCYQFPATQFNGTTVIFSPLIALMRDQVQKLQSLGISAKAIHSNQTEEENLQIIHDAENNHIKILYIAPERMENAQWLQTARTMKLSMVVVDEAHCVSMWGHDFRPAFRRIVNLVNLLPSSFPVLATTATATKRVEQDILSQIGKNMYSMRGTLLRPNLRLRVAHVASEDEKMLWLGENIEKLPGTGIIYTGTQISTQIYANWFNYLKIPSVAYNSRVDPESRKIIEQGLLDNAYKCVVSTNALGMGIDKPDIRFIIHTQIPQSPVHYYQEIGRAGRDGRPALILLFYNPKDDLHLPKSFIESAKPSDKKYYAVINAIKSERLGLHQLIKTVNLKQTQVRVILADLIEQGIVNEVLEGKNKKYEYKFNAPQLNITTFEELRNSKFNELEKMVQYTNLKQCRMQFLCDFLGDSLPNPCENCDNDTGKHIKVTIIEPWRSRLENFKGNYFPELELEPQKGENRKNPIKHSPLVNGVAASYYGFSNVGKTLHQCKYQHGVDFPDDLVNLTLKAFYHHYRDEQFDLVLYVPPTESGNLVKNFAGKIAQALNLPISDNLRKIRTTLPQKSFETNLLKGDNVAGAFEYEPSRDIQDKSILLVDDIFDSGATIKEIGKYLSKLGAVKVAPLVIAKTVGGDI